MLERGPDGRAMLVETLSDAKVRSIRARLRFFYNPPRVVGWVQEQGDVRSMEGSWTLEDLGRGRTRATYSLSADPGRLLGMLLRGPLQAKVQNFLVLTAVEGLKKRAEAS